MWYSKSFFFSKDLSHSAHLNFLKGLIFKEEGINSSILKQVCFKDEDLKGDTNVKDEFYKKFERIAADTLKIILAHLYNETANQLTCPRCKDTFLSRDRPQEHLRKEAYNIAYFVTKWNIIKKFENSINFEIKRESDNSESRVVDYEVMAEDISNNPANTGQYQGSLEIVSNKMDGFTIFRRGKGTS